ncbi:MAG: hypothetical protein GY820_04660 [Gammaproteobacteria bacterium]|nr:hypothetical protein [Gammaproteobacteria bacterium]
MSGARIHSLGEHPRARFGSGPVSNSSPAEWKSLCAIGYFFPENRCIFNAFSFIKSGITNPQFRFGRFRAKIEDLGEYLFGERTKILFVSFNVDSFFTVNNS